MAIDLRWRYEIIEGMIRKCCGKMEVIYFRDNKDIESMEYRMSQIDRIERYGNILSRLLKYKHDVHVRLMDDIIINHYVK